MRPQNWPALLHDTVERARRSPFDWGTNDCVSFTCDWRMAMTGVDVYAPFRGRYDSEVAALRIMSAHGVACMEDAGDFLFGRPMTNVRRCRRGDLVLAQGDLPALGICLGAVAVCPTRACVVFYGLSKFTRAWAVD